MYLKHRFGPDAAAVLQRPSSRSEPLSATTFSVPDIAARVIFDIVHAGRYCNTIGTQLQESDCVVSTHHRRAAAADHHQDFGSCHLVF
jgi:hypothetical protein